MKIYKISLTPYGSISSFPNSQTVFGSICWAIRELYGEKDLEELLDNFISNENRFVVSSVFLNGLYKAPMKIWSNLDEIIDIGKKFKIDNSQLSRQSKKLKKINYMSEDIFKDYMKGKIERREVVESLILDRGKYEFTSGILHHKNKNKFNVDLYKESGRRNFINRITGTTEEGQLFYYNRNFLSPGTKLYFLIKTNNIDYYIPVFKYMSDSAIGGDKSIGVNNYEVEFQGEFKYEKNIEENILISKYIPNYEEIDWEKSYFKIGRGNFKVESRFELSGNNVFKNEIGYLEEGSKLIVKEEKDIYGKLPVVKEIKGKKIRHNGLGFFL